MNIRILGCSPVLADTHCFNCSGYLVDSLILFDCGPGIWKALCQMSLPCTRLSHIVLSHFHVDHTSDLSVVLLARYLSSQSQNPVRIIGPVGLKEWFDKLTGLIGPWSRKMDTEIIELDNSLPIGDYILSGAPTPHTDNSLCYRLVDKNERVFFYSGDSDYTESLAQTAANADIALIECSNTEETKLDGHLTPEHAARIAAHANVKHLVLTHMYPEVRRINVTEQVKKYFSGKTTLARDDLIIEI
jgi:ribonuclease BN (tRNA processing enzyme)